MKKIIITSIILILSFIYLVPKYEELNNLTIIETISIYKENDNYIISLKEVVPIKEGNRIKYKYKTYKTKSSNIKDGIKELERQNKKRFYLRKVKSLQTNINNKLLIKQLNINPKNINYIE